MEYMTIVIRWCNEPRAHININTKGVTSWYMSRWTYGTPAAEHLTVICIHIASTNVVKYTQETLRVMQSLWADPHFNFMQLCPFDLLLKDKTVVCSSTINNYSIVHTDTKPGCSFYDHVSNTVALLKVCEWTTLGKELTRADQGTTFKMHCKHKPHSVTVLVPGPGSVTKMITVQCEEPQRIYDLMKKYGLPCSNVWDSAISLSARSPCTALVDHNMTIVNAHKIPQADPFGTSPDISGFYHDMNYVRVQTRRSALRYKPYNCPYMPSSAPLGLIADVSTECIPVALNYHDQMSKLADVIKGDGRFLTDVTCQTDDTRTIGGDIQIDRLERYDDPVIITGYEDESSESDGESEP